MYSNFNRYNKLMINSYVFESPLDIKYSIKYDRNSSENGGNIKVYGLSKDSLNNLEIGNKVTLNSGYKEGVVGVIFNGIIISVETEDLLTTIEVKEATYDKQINVNKHYIPGTPVSTVVNNLCSILGIDIYGEYNDFNYISGKTIKGDAKQNLFNIIRDELNIVDYNVTNNTIYLSPNVSKLFTIDTNTGIKEIPKKIDDGYKITHVLIPGIEVNSKLRVNSKYLSGDFIVDKVHHADFTTILEVV